MALRRLLVPLLLALAALSVQAATAQAANAPPTSCFTRTPTHPVPNEAITFDSTCTTDTDGTIARVAWDLDDDGNYEEENITSRTYTRTWDAGTYTVRLLVEDNQGARSESRQTFTIAPNKAPTAAFTSAPAKPLAGATVTLSSNATDSDGSVAAHAWDLDNDGQFDDATGPTATWKPAAAGAFTVSLRATDDRGASSAASETITVAARPAAPPPPSGGTDFDVSTPIVTPPPPSAPPLAGPTVPRLLDPFPVVRMRGRTTGRGARLTLLSIRVPHGATVRLRCLGRGCPVKRLRRKVATKSKAGARTVRFRRMERFLPAGIKLEVTVRRPGMVGKFTRIRIRRVKLPVRVDRCVLPGSARPAACPEAR